MVVTCTRKFGVLLLRWRRAILHKRSGELSQSVRCSSGKIESNRHVPRKISSVCSMFFKKRWDYQLQSYRRQTLFWKSSSRGIRSTLHATTLRGSHGDVDKVKVLLKRALSSNNCAEENELPKKPKHSLPDMIYPSTMQITMAMPPLNCMRELYFVVCRSTTKNAKIGPFEIFPLYGSLKFKLSPICSLHLAILPNCQKGRIAIGQLEHKLRNYVSHNVNASIFWKDFSTIPFTKTFSQTYLHLHTFL